MRKITLQQGRTDIQYILEKYHNKMRTKKACDLVDITLLCVAKGAGAEFSNVLITQYQLNRPCNGSHKWFDDGEDRLPVIKLDPNFVVPSEWKIYPKRKEVI